MQMIPLSKTPAQTLNIVLNNQPCTISLYWRQTYLFMDLSVEDKVIFKGAICQNLADIIQSPTRDFLGSLHFFDSEGSAAPKWEELHDGSSGRWVLIYLDSSEKLPDDLRY